MSYPGGWFGESWGAPVCEENRHRPTPVGSQCVECTQPITEDDQGVLIPGEIGNGYELLGFHLICFLSTILPRRDT